MAPKAKKSKKQDDNWDEGLGEVADPIAQAAAEAKAAEAQADADDDDAAGGGGLMAALRKNKEKRKKKGKTTDNDFVDGEDPTAAEEEAPAADLAAKAPVEASMDDEFDLPKKGKQAKGGKQQQKDDQEEEGDGKLKTKAEKEKEKKERQKQKKKEEAAKKKSTPAAAIKQEEKPTAAPVEAPKVEAPGKKKKLNPALAALQKQQEELRRRQEESQQAAAAEKARIEEEERLAAEEEQRRAEARAAKKEKEKKKIEEMKKAGTYKTEKQKKDEAQAKLRLQQMLDSGVAKVEGVTGAESRTTKKDDRKKRNPKKEAEERRAKEEAEQQQRALELRQKEEQAKKLEEEAAKAKANAEEKKDEESEEEDWEAMADKDDVKDSWDAPSDEEEVKPAAVKAPAKAAEDEDEDDSEEDSDEDSDDSEDEQETAAQRQARERKEQAQAKRQQELEAARAAASTENLRSPISCILGHVDVGKTKLLDKIRQTNVQDQEVGGITQQIGATYFPVDALRQKTAVVNPDSAFEFKIPGLLIIDTPGHESFSNLRSRGSSLCNIAILVVDILHLLEPQTLESLRLLKERKTPFIVALNKIDRLYDWKAIPNNGFKDSLSKQKASVQSEFADRLNRTKVAFAEQGFNAELFYENKSLAKNVSLVPTSAHTGEGVPDLLKLLCMLTQERMTKQLMYLSHAEATVLEVKEIQGLGVTIDVILSNGILREGDTCVVSGTDGPIRFVIRALLTPGDMRELRVKANYVHNKVVKASLGVKIAANGLETAIAGSRLLVAKDPEDEDELEDLEEDVMGDLEGLMSRITKSGRGVTVQASTLGSLEALLEFLKQSKIPVGNIGIGPVHKRDIITASTALEKAPEYAVMLCFDVKVDKEAQELADQMGVTIFAADIIYHLFDKFTKHMKEIADKKKEDSKMLAVFPCTLRPVAVFNKTNPIVVGVDVIEGSLRLTTPIAAVRINSTTKAKEVIDLGRVTSIERDHKQLTICKKGQPSVAVKIEMANQVAYGRHLAEEDMLYSHISRQSIDTLKEYFREDVDKEDWQLIAKHLKPLFDIS